MAIAEVTKLVPPPSRPSEVGLAAQWSSIERELGIALPSEFRDFAFAYGSGLFARFYRIYNPFAKSEFTALVPSVHRVCGYVREKRKNWPNEVPFLIYPETGGLLPWGNDENGNDYYWLTKGSPDDWTVVAEAVRGSGFREHGCSMTEFLTQILTGKIPSLGGDYPDREDLVFEPWSIETP